MPGIFTPALEEMATSGATVFGPVAFREYTRAHGLSAGQTATHISVNDWAALAPELKAANTMVLRLGRGDDARTRFMLVACGDAGDFFLPASSSMAEAATLLSNASVRDLFAYSLLDPSEHMLVSLACASGVLSEALALDGEQLPPPPVRGTMRGTFEFRPHSGHDLVVEHRDGQIEIDALLVARSCGEETLFVIEAKHRDVRLAKHKLVYPVLALAPRVPTDVRIVPVFLACEVGSTGVTFHAARCTMPDPRAESPVALDALAVEERTTLRLPLVMYGG
jgi:hypothetical protein